MTAARRLVRGGHTVCPQRSGVPAAGRGRYSRSAVWRSSESCVVRPWAGPGRPSASTAEV
jgi:hypothetical protein